MRSFILLLCLAALCTARPSPVLLVPGLSGSQIEGRKEGDAKWQTLWVNVYDETIAINKTLETLKLQWDAATNSYANVSGWEVRSGDGLTAINYLAKIGSIGIEGSDYYQKMIKYLEKKGLVRDVDIRGVPFDWRLPKSALMDIGWFAEVERNIEAMYSSAGGMSVVVVAHCYGAVLLAEHWSSKAGPSQEWKDKYVKAFVPVAAPFLGASVALEMILSGSDDGYEFLNIPLLPLHPMRAWGRTVGGMASLIPRKGFVDDSADLARTIKRGYTYDDLGQLLEDAGALLSKAQLEAIAKFGLATPAAHPGTRVYCIGSSGTNTTTAWGYDSEELFEKKAKILSAEDGDGTVTHKSAIYCQEWQKQRPEMPFAYSEFEGLGHLQIVKSAKFHDALFKDVIDNN